jgi:hypothetical protein
MCPCLHFNQNAAIVDLETQLLSAQNVAIVNSCCCLTNHPSFAPSRATQYSTPPDHPLADSTQASKRPVCHCFLLCRSGGRASQYLLYKPPSRPLNFYSRPPSTIFRKFLFLLELRKSSFQIDTSILEIISSSIMYPSSTQTPRRTSPQKLDTTSRSATQPSTSSSPHNMSPTLDDIKRKSSHPP